MEASFKPPDRDKGVDRISKLMRTGSSVSAAVKRRPDREGRDFYLLDITIDPKASCHGRLDILSSSTTQSKYITTQERIFTTVEVYRSVYKTDEYRYSKPIGLDTKNTKIYPLIKGRQRPSIYT
jgi:hypothetical protein